MKEMRTEMQQIVASLFYLIVRKIQNLINKGRESALPSVVGVI